MPILVVVWGGAEGGDRFWDEGYDFRKGEDVGGDTNEFMVDGMYFLD